MGLVGRKMDQNTYIDTPKLNLTTQEKTLMSRINYINNNHRKNKWSKLLTY